MVQPASIMEEKETKMFKRLIMTTAALALAGAISTPPAKAADFVYGTYLPPKHSAVRTLPTVFAKLKKESKGSLSWKVVSGGQLFGAKASLDGAGKGMADASVLILPYFASALRHGRGRYTIGPHRRQDEGEHSEDAAQGGQGPFHPRRVG